MTITTLKDVQESFGDLRSVNVTFGESALGWRKGQWFATATDRNTGEVKQEYGDTLEDAVNLLLGGGLTYYYCHGESGSTFATKEPPEVVIGDGGNLVEQIDREQHLKLIEEGWTTGAVVHAADDGDLLI